MNPDLPPEEEDEEGAAALASGFAAFQQIKLEDLLNRRIAKC